LVNLALVLHFHLKYFVRFSGPASAASFFRKGFSDSAGSNFRTYWCGCFVLPRPAPFLAARNDAKIVPSPYMVTQRPWESIRKIQLW